MRHGSASLQLAAGIPIAVVSKRLGHSSIAITSDTYSHLLDGVGRQAAEAAAALVPRGDSGCRVWLSAQAPTFQVAKESLQVRCSRADDAPVRAGQMSVREFAA